MRGFIYPGPDPGEFFGVRRTVAIPQPSAGSTFSVQVPGGEFWRILFLFFTFTTDANVANRQAGVNFTDADNLPFWQVRSPSTVAANLTGAFGASMAGGGVTPGTATRSTVELPDVPLEPGTKIFGAMDSLQIGDQLSAPKLIVQAFDYGADGWQNRRVDFDAATGAPNEE